MKHFFAHASWLKKLVGGVAVGVIVGVIVGWILNLTSQRHYSGPPVKIDEVIDERDGELQGKTWVFADALRLSPATLSGINGPLELEREHGVQNPNPFDRWAIANGGVDPSPEITRVILEGNRSSAVEILGIRASAQCQQPLDGTIFYSPTAGADPVAMMGFNLDSSEPTAQKATGGVLSSQPYFETTTISLAPEEHQVIDIVTVTHHHFCRYTFTLKVLNGDKMSTEAFDDDGKPFEVSALEEGGSSLFSHYHSVYIGGVVTPNGLSTQVSPHYKLP